MYSTLQDRARSAVTAALPGTKTLATNNPFIFPTGDVKMLVTYNNELVEGKASSHALVLASPVWTRFLFPPWASPPTANPTTMEPKKIDCCGDDSAALLILLNIIHLKFSRVPKSINTATLLQVAILCDQYACVSIVQPWLVGWTHDEISRSRQQGEERWLFIAWVFGRVRVFEELSDRMVLEVKMNGKGEYTDREGKVLSEPLPNGIIESVLQIRASTIERLLEIPHAAIKPYERFNKTMCRLQSDNASCDALSFGCLTRRLVVLGLYPKRPIEEITWSVTEVARAITSSHIHFMPHNKSYYDSRDHSECCHHRHRFEAKVAAVLKKIESPVLDSHRMHMETQEQRSGDGVLGSVR